MCKTGDIYISKKVNVYDLLDSGDDAKLLELVENDKVQHFEIEEFIGSFIPSLERDLAMLQRLKEHWSQITVDPKLAEFKKEPKNNKILSNNKIIIFTESKETAAYLGNELTMIYGDKVVVFSGESSEYLKRDIERSYNPKYKNEGQDKYSILSTTDVLAEGINLHRSNVVINYDLPWNPTKIMQRVGRINRVGTEHDRIFVFNFFPTSQTNAQLPLKDRIMEKLQSFYDTLGEDFKYLSEEEEVSSHKLYRNLTENMEDNEEGTNPELAYLAVIRKIRDNETDLFDKIKRLPIKAKTGKYSNIVESNATITFLFEPLESYDWEHTRFGIPNELFSNRHTKGNRDADGILDIFDRYNEDEPLEREVAVDPEMLGKIFENLLDVKDRKSKGAFYTPREIVHYMCQESIINYLVNKTDVPYEDMKDFILYGELMKDEDCSKEASHGKQERRISESV